jgi:hypothetical protein
MSIAYDTLDLAAARPVTPVQPLAAAVTGLRFQDLPYVGLHRRHDGQDGTADSLRPQSAHRPRHRRLVSSAS